MTVTNEVCPICDIADCHHIRARRGKMLAVDQQRSIGHRPLPIYPVHSLGALPLPEVANLHAQLAARDQTIADLRAMIDVQAKVIARLEELVK